MKRLSTVFFLVAGCAVAQTYTYYTRSGIGSQVREYGPFSTTGPTLVGNLDIECDCTTTQVVISGDPYNGNIITMSSSNTKHVVNPVVFFTIGVEVPDGLPFPCHEPITVDGHAYLADTIDVSTGLDLPGIGSDVQLEWIYSFIVYHRSDGYESYCDGIVIEVRANTSIAPC